MSIGSRVLWLFSRLVATSAVALLSATTSGAGISAGEASASALPITITRAKGKLRVEAGGKLFTEYRFEGSPKPILYPIHGPDGQALTRNYPMGNVPGEAKDHPHQRSLWFTHGSVNGISFWHEGSDAGKILQDEIVEVASGSPCGRIVTRNRWVAPDGRVICTDRRSVSFRAKEDARTIDFEVTVHADHGALTFGDTKEGTMGIRTHPALRLRNDPGRGVTGAKGHALNSEGVRDRDLWGKRADWVDYWAPIDGKVVGIAIFDHPANPRHPTWWHARDYGLIAANPFGIHNFERKPAHTGDMKVEAGKSVTFRYRFLFHRGDPEAAGIAKRYAEYARSASPATAGR